MSECEIKNMLFLINRPIQRFAHKDHTVKLGAKTPEKYVSTSGQIQRFQSTAGSEIILKISILV